LPRVDGRDMLLNGYRVAHYKTPITACRACPQRAQCIRSPEASQQRQLTVIKHLEGPFKPKRRSKGAPAERMRRKFDRLQRRAFYAKRIQAVEAVFASLQNKGMRRFMLRGCAKVNARTRSGVVYMVHNVERIARQGAWECGAEGCSKGDARSGVSAFSARPG
jgi:Transposase DDE domain